MSSGLPSRYYRSSFIIRTFCPRSSFKPRLARAYVTAPFGGRRAVPPAVGSGGRDLAGGGGGVTSVS